MKQLCNTMNIAPKTLNQALAHICNESYVADDPLLFTKRCPQMDYIGQLVHCIYTKISYFPMLKNYICPTYLMLFFSNWNMESELAYLLVTLAILPQTFKTIKAQIVPLDYVLYL